MKNNDYYAALSAFNLEYEKYSFELHRLCWAAVCQLNIGADEKAHKTALAADQLHEGMKEFRLANQPDPDDFPENTLLQSSAEAG